MLAYARLYYTLFPPVDLLPFGYSYLLAWTGEGIYSKSFHNPNCLLMRFVGRLSVKDVAETCVCFNFLELDAPNTPAIESFTRC